MGCQSSPSTMLVCIIRQEYMEIYIYMLVENVNMDVLVKIYINDLETVKMDNIHYIIISYLLSSCPQHPFTTNSCFYL